MLPRAVTGSPRCSIQNQQTANIRPPVQFQTIVYIVDGFVAVVGVAFLAVVVPVLVAVHVFFVDVAVDVVLAELTASELSDYVLEHCFVFENFD
jgi:hypothetical protein